MSSAGGRAHGRWSTAAAGMIGLAVALVVGGCTSTPPVADDVVTVTATVAAPIDAPVEMPADPATASDPAVAPSTAGPVVVPPLNGPAGTTASSPTADIEVEPTSS